MRKRVYTLPFRRENFRDMNTRTLLQFALGGGGVAANTTRSSPLYIAPYTIYSVVSGVVCTRRLYIEFDPLSFHDNAREKRTKRRGKNKDKRARELRGLEEKAKTSKAPGVAQLLSTLHSAPRRRHHPAFIPLFHTKNAL